MNPQEKRSHVRLPQGWKRLHARGLGSFVTHEVHRRPDGTRSVWTSRRHRKRRGGRIESEAGVTPAHEPRPLRLWGWEPDRLQWWIVVVYILGSLMLVIGGLGPFTPNRVVHTVHFSLMGSICFTIAGYLSIFEAINASPHVDASASAPRRRIYWAWMPGRIEWLGAFFIFVGGLLFKLCYVFGALKWLDWLEVDLLIALPGLLGALGFLIGSWLLFCEVCHGPWAFLPRELSWWIGLTNVLGSAGYVVSGLFGFFGEGPILLEQTWGNYFAVLFGAANFLVGSYLMMPEALDHAPDDG